MNKTLYRLLSATVVAAMTVLPAAAQEFRTSYFMETSPFRHQMNPALIDSGRTAILVGNINVSTWSNLGVGDLVYKLRGNSRYDLTTFMSPTVSADRFLSNIRSENRFDAYINWNIFSVAFKGFGGNNLIEANLRSNTNIHLPYEIFEFMKTAGEKEQYDLSNIGIRSQSYVELALGHSHRLNDRWTIGAKMKFLVGAAYADLNVDRLDVTMNGDEWRVSGDARLKAAVLSSQFSHDDATKNDPKTGRQRVDGIDDVSVGLPGFGMAFDLGTTFKVNDNLTLSAGLTDLGWIRWKDTKLASSAGEYTFDGFNEIYAGGHDVDSKKIGDQFDDMGDDLEELFSVYDDGQKTTNQALAATLNIGAEYTLKAYDKLKFGLLYTGRYHGIYSYNQVMLSANIHPVKVLEGAFSMAAGGVGVNFGAALNLNLRHNTITFGTDRFFGKLAKGCYLPVRKSSCNFVIGSSWRW
jgi:hypothetical protein